MRYLKIINKLDNGVNVNDENVNGSYIYSFFEMYIWPYYDNLE